MKTSTQLQLFLGCCLRIVQVLMEDLNLIPLQLPIMVLLEEPLRVILTALGQLLDLISEMLKVLSLHGSVLHHLLLQLL